MKNTSKAGIPALQCSCLITCKPAVSAFLLGVCFGNRKWELRVGRLIGELKGERVKDHWSTVVLFTVLESLRWMPTPLLSCGLYAFENVDN